MGREENKAIHAMCVYVGWMRERKHPRAGAKESIHALGPMGREIPTLQIMERNQT